MSEIKVGDSIGSVVGSSAEIVSVGGSASHIAQLSAGLEVNGVTPTNAPSGAIAAFALANAQGYAPATAGSTQPSMVQKIGLSA